MDQINLLETKVCKACGVVKQLKRFQKLPSGNRGNVCNLCKSLGNKIKKDGEKKTPPRKNNALQLGNVGIKDYRSMYEYLEKIGYSLTEDIHEQFCKKYGLTPTKKKKKFNRQYTPEDCGLISSQTS